MNLTRQMIVITVLMLYTSLAAAQVAARFNVLITEIFPDPVPAVGLPQSEFIELKNVSSMSWNLKDWKISDGTTTAVITANYILFPDSIVIICSNSVSASFSNFGKTIGISGFPSLDNDADLISLRSKEGHSIHAVDYNKAWYQNELKANGGWTLEIIDTRNPCSGITNWKPSIDPKGGTPGKTNSVNGISPDDLAPALLRTYTYDSSTIIAVFDEATDSISAAINTNYRLDNNLQPLAAIPAAPIFNEVILKFPNRLPADIVYHLTAQNISDCAGNVIGIQHKAKAGVPATADTFDIAINEILFNPRNDGFDFIELYNKSKKIFDLKDLYVANINVVGGLANIKQLSTIPYLFFPGDYIVLTESALWLSKNYVLKPPQTLLELPALPSFPDDKGTAVISNFQGKSIDELQYDSKWHFALIDNNEGISLERIDYARRSQDKNNWTSAASTAGFATPGYQNSQFKTDHQLQGMVTISPALFSPDNDGLDDFATIQYHMIAPGYVANIIIFDANGRIVRHLAKNATLGLHGNFRWDGLNDKLLKLPMGIYVVFTEIFNLQGKTRKFKNVLTLARRF